MALVALTCAVVGVLAWRLSQGPLELPWLVSRIEAAANANGSPARLSIGSVALTWEGFRLGVDRPLDLRISGITVTDTTGSQRIAIPRAEVSLSLHELLLGRIEPRAVEIDEPSVTLIRAADGTLGLDLGGAADATDKDRRPAAIAGSLAVLAGPPTDDRRFSALQRVRIHDAKLTIEDRQLGVTWQVPQAELDFSRGPQGGVEGTAELAVALGDQQARLTAAATLTAGAAQTHLRMRMTPVAPAALARIVPSLAALSMLDAPVSGEADIELGQDLAVRQMRLTVRAGGGDAHLGQGRVKLLDAAIVVAGTPALLTIETAQANLRGHADGTPTLVQAHGTLQRGASRMIAALSLDVDQLDLADLSRLWPEGTGGGARSWVVQNITAGSVRNGHADFDLEARDDDWSSFVLSHISGKIDGSGVRVFWMRPIPPIENAQGQLRLVDQDTLEIVVNSGQQRLRGQPDNAPGELTLRAGRMRITGMTQPKQTSTIDADIAGSLPDAIALLREPSLKVLDKNDFNPKNPSGQATAKLSIGLPLEADINPDAITLRVLAHLDAVHLGAVAGGRDLDRGVLDLDVTTAGMKLTGKALLAGIAAQIDGTMDFRPGGPSQVVQTINVSGAPDASQLTAAGLDVGGVLSGPVGLQATLTEHRSGQGDLVITADLAAAELTAPALEWHKLADTPATGSARLVLDRDQLLRIETIRLDGRALEVRGSADCAAGKISLLRLERLVLGRTVGKGEIRFPAAPGTGPIVASISGAAIDLAERLGHHAPPRRPSETRTAATPGLPWTVDAQFDRALMAQERVFNGLVLHAESDGHIVQRLRLDGQTANFSPFHLEITPEAGRRSLVASSANAGDLLRGLDVVHTMEGGRLSVRANFDDTKPERPLSGSADVEDFRIRNAPALAKLLQAMTLYGLVEAMRGSGLGFSQLVGPFRLTGDIIELSEARAFSSSLGLTMQGRIDLNAERIDMQGTIVPAYFFNSMLGNVPLVGKLFSPESGGGVFAASYTLSGPLEDPDVFINPLTALTPGFLRGLFGIF